MAGISSPLQLFGDFGFSGGEDIAPNPLQDNQVCINFYAEVNKQNAKEILGLLGCPGLIQLVAAPGGGVPVPGNGNFAPNTLLLLHFDGTNGSTSFIDDVGNTFAAHGTAQLDTSTEQFGPSSGKFTGTGGTDYCATTSTLSATTWNIGSDFTIECWIKPTATTADFIFQADSGSNGQHIDFSISGGGALQFGIKGTSGTTTSHTGTAILTVGVWQHIAMSKNGNTIRLFIGGVLDTSWSVTDTYNLGSSGAIASIGNSNTGGNTSLTKHIDEFRFCATGLYTSNFTPTGPFTLNSNPTTSSWPLPSTVIGLPVRGMWELPSDNTALAVIGNTCYLVTLATPATPTAFATLALTSVGTLLTSTGPVHIRDNNIGGHAVIVDGPYGYLYTIATQAFARITDPAFLGADTVAFIDGWWIFNQPGTQTFYTNFPQYGTGFNGSYFALKDSSADNLVAVEETKEQLWLIGDKTTEIWYDAGGQYFPFQRLVGTPLQVGCKAKHSVARFNSEGQDGLVWFGRSERGENSIVRTRGFAYEVISTPAFSAQVSQYPITSDAIGYTYQEDTHEFYMLIFPTADTTWCYDAQTGLLHKRLSYDPYLQKFHRHRSNCFMNFAGMRIVGDYQCGSLFQLTRNSYTDAGWPLLAKRRSPHVWDKGQRGRVFMASLQLDFNQGVGNPSGMGSNPQAGIQISRDGGKTFGQRWYAPIGQIGQYRNRTMWRKLAFGRDNVIDLEVIDPVKRDLIGVTLKAFSSA